MVSKMDPEKLNNKLERESIRRVTRGQLTADEWFDMPFEDRIRWAEKTVPELFTSSTLNKEGLP